MINPVSLTWDQSALDRIAEIRAEAQSRHPDEDIILALVWVKFEKEGLAAFYKPSFGVYRKSDVTMQVFKLPDGQDMVYAIHDDELKNFDDKVIYYSDMDSFSLRPVSSS